MKASLKLGFIGTHGVGKTTLCYGLAARLKARDVVLDIVHEVARRCPLPINEHTSLAAQSWILHTQVADELVASARHPVVLCDRSVLDNYVYLLLSAGRQPGLEALVSWWLSTYDLQNNLTRLEDPAGGVTLRTYDEDGNVLTQTEPYAATSEGIWQVQGDTLTYEVVETDPGLGATPPANGFGSTSNGQFGDDNIQIYRRVR